MYLQSTETRRWNGFSRQKNNKQNEDKFAKVDKVGTWRKTVANFWREVNLVGVLWALNRDFRCEFPPVRLKGTRVQSLFHPEYKSILINQTVDAISFKRHRRQIEFTERDADKRTLPPKFRETKEKMIEFHISPTK